MDKDLPFEVLQSINAEMEASKRGIKEPPAWITGPTGLRNTLLLEKTEELSTLLDDTGEHSTPLDDT